LEKELEPRLEEAKEGKRVVLFADAVHFVCGSFLGCLWCLTRIFVPTMSGRQRYNLLGAINAITHDFHKVCNDTYINALTVSELLRQVSEFYAGKVITIVLDNARYQHCNAVMELAKALNIELLFLPSYSPNLNIIERLWKWAKKDCLNCKYYENFVSFKEAINKTLDKVGNYSAEKELKTLLALNFQIYDNAIYNRV